MIGPPYDFTLVLRGLLEIHTAKKATKRVEGTKQFERLYTCLFLKGEQQKKPFFLKGQVFRDICPHCFWAILFFLELADVWSPLAFSQPAENTPTSVLPVWDRVVQEDAGSQWHCWQCHWLRWRDRDPSHIQLSKYFDRWYCVPAEEGLRVGPSALPQPWKTLLTLLGDHAADRGAVEEDNVPPSLWYNTHYGP